VTFNDYAPNNGNSFSLAFQFLLSAAPSVSITPSPVAPVASLVGPQFYCRTSTGSYLTCNSAGGESCQIFHNYLTRTSTYPSTCTTGCSPSTYVSSTGTTAYSYCCLNDTALTCPDVGNDPPPGYFYCQPPANAAVSTTGLRAMCQVGLHECYLTFSYSNLRYTNAQCLTLGSCIPSSTPSGSTMSCCYGSGQQNCSVALPAGYHACNTSSVSVGICLPGYTCYMQYSGSTGTCSRFGCYLQNQCTQSYNAVSQLYTCCTTTGSCGNCPATCYNPAGCAIVGGTPCGRPRCDSSALSLFAALGALLLYWLVA